MPCLLPPRTGGAGPRRVAGGGLIQFEDGLVTPLYAAASTLHIEQDTAVEVRACLLPCLLCLLAVGCAVCPHLTCCVCLRAAAASVRCLCAPFALH